MRKSKSQGLNELLYAEEQKSMAEYSNQNMIFRVYSARKNEQLKQASTSPTKSTMKIRRQRQVQPEIPNQREPFRGDDSNPNQIFLLRRNEQLQGKLQKYKGKILDLKAKLNGQDSYIKFLEQCNKGLKTQSQENIRKYQEYINALNSEFQEKNQTQAEQIERLAEELKLKHVQIVEIGKLLKNSEQQVNVLNSRLSSKEKQLQKLINQHETQIEEIDKHQRQQSQQKINQLEKILMKQKLRVQQLVKNYQKALTEKQSIILKMSKFNNDVTQKMLTQKAQLFQQETSSQLFLKQSKSRLQKECSLLKQELRKMKGQYQKSRAIEEQQKYRIRYLEGLIYQKNQKVKDDIANQQQAKLSLRKRIRSVEVLKREIPAPTPLNIFIEQFNPNQYSFESSHQNLEGRDWENNQGVSNDIKEIGKAFAQLSLNLERIITDKLVKGQMQSAYHSRRGSELQIRSRNYNERKNNAFKNQEIMMLIELLANQKQNYSNIEKRLLNAIGRYHQGNETRNRGTDSYSPHVPKSCEFKVQNQTYIPEKYHKKSPSANLMHTRNAQHIRQASSYQYQFVNQNQSGPKMASFIQSTKSNSKFGQEQQDSMSAYMYKRIRDSDAEKTAEGKMYRLINNQKFNIDHRF